MRVYNFQKAAELSQEQHKLGTFVPGITHSFSENAPVAIFHAQVLSDWNTIIELSDKVLEELKSHVT